MASCNLKTGNNNMALACTQSMLQYAWFNKDIESELKAYSILALTYFNLADLKNSKYYHDRELTM